MGNVKSVTALLTAGVFVASGRGFARINSNIHTDTDVNAADVRGAEQRALLTETEDCDNLKAKAMEAMPVADVKQKLCQCVLKGDATTMKKLGLEFNKFKGYPTVFGEAAGKANSGDC